MKHFLRLFLVLAMFAMTSCYDSPEKDVLDETFQNLDQTQIKFLGEQFDAISKSIKELKGLQDAINAQINQLNEEASMNAKQIEDLKKMNQKLDGRIGELQKFIDEKFSTYEDWAKGTFATLEQQSALATDLAQLKDTVENLPFEDIYAKIETVESTLKSWVNEQLSAYATIADTEAKIAALKKDLETSAAENKKDLEAKINDLSAALDAAKAEISEAYTAAIQSAINEAEGRFSQALSEEIASVNANLEAQIAALNRRITAIENRLSDLERVVEELLASIQSIVYVPAYQDGMATIEYTSNMDVCHPAPTTFQFEIRPMAAAADLIQVWQEAMNMKAVYTKTSRGAELIDMPIETVSEENGILSVTVSGCNLSNDFFRGNVGASARLEIGYGSTRILSDYIPMIAKEVVETNADAPVVEFFGGVQEDVVTFTMACLSQDATEAYFLFGDKASIDGIVAQGISLEEIVDDNIKNATQFSKQQGWLDAFNSKGFSLNNKNLDPYIPWTGLLDARNEAGRTITRADTTIPPQGPAIEIFEVYAINIYGFGSDHSASCLLNSHNAVSGKVCVIDADRYNELATTLSDRKIVLQEGRDLTQDEMFFVSNGKLELVGNFSNLMPDTNYRYGAVLFNAEGNSSVCWGDLKTAPAIPHGNDEGCPAVVAEGWAGDACNQFTADYYSIRLQGAEVTKGALLISYPSETLQLLFDAGTDAREIIDQMMLVAPEMCEILTEDDCAAIRTAEGKVFTYPNRNNATNGVIWSCRNKEGKVACGYLEIETMEWN